MSYGYSITIWDATTNQSRTFPKILREPRWIHTMQCVHEGDDLLICGGYYAPKSCELCHMSLPSPLCVSVSDMPTARVFHASVAVSDTQVLIIGGAAQDAKPVNTVYSYDTKLDLWDMTLPSMIEFRSNCPGAAILGQKQVLVCGGQNKDYEFLASCEMLDLNLKSENQGWQTVGSMLERRHQFGMVRMGDGLIYALGGVRDNQGDKPQLSVEIFVPEGQNWIYANFNLTTDVDTFLTAVRML